MVHCHCTLSLYTVHVHCQSCHCLLSLYMVHCILALYAVTADCTPPRHIATIHCHYTLSLYIVHCTLYIVHCTLYTVHCTLYTVHYTLYSPRSHRMSPHTQCVRHNGQDSTLALYTITLHSLYAVIVHCHCTLSLYAVTVNLVRFVLEAVDGILSPALCSSLTRPPPPPHSYSQNPNNSYSHSESCNCSLRHSQGHTH